MMRSFVFLIAVTLVCSAMAVPSPSAEESEAIRSKRDHNPNEYDQIHDLQCRTGEGLYRIWSKHSNGAEDRKFEYKCRSVTSPLNVKNCDWTDYVNDYDAPVSFMCPANQYLGGTASRHSNGKEDRQFKFQCCYGGFTSRECELVGYLNDYDAEFTYEAPSGYTFAGMTSVHHSGTEDRRFKFLLCKFSAQ